MSISRIGFVGLGRMGLPMTHLLARHGLVVAFDHNPSVSASAIKKRSVVNLCCVSSLKELVDNLIAPRVIWLMIPAMEVSSCLEYVTPLLREGDIIIDGGNSAVADSQRRHETLLRSGIRFVSIGCSGGLEGAEHGPPMSVSCDPEILPTIKPWLHALGGNYTYYREIGFGHLAKGLHNAIEYGMMQSLAEGISLYFAHGFSQQQILDTLSTWSKGSIIQSSLLDCLIFCIKKDNFRYTQKISKSETVGLLKELAINGHPTPCIDASIQTRENPNLVDSRTQTALALMRKHFGGHATRSDDSCNTR